ncbi:MAG: ABC-2 family transporter protein [Candidatus Peregrinibacteria bacterium]|nr:ABC-2 family transporter protein [Candidatus Peregrinibacteria bacterium]MDZ4244858.1 ABC-2 family transporter protein [Candidatus Gracilibacteria bacterium]
MQIIAWFISFLLYFYLWRAIFASNANIGTYTITTMLTYFFLVQVMRNLLFSYYGFVINSDIQNGDMANLMTKPISLLPYYYALEIGRNLVKFLISIISNVFILALFWQFFDFSTISAGSILLGLLAAIPAHFINYCFVSMIGCLAFWLTDANRLIFFYFALTTLAAGWIVPIDLFPEPFQTILMYTPFPYAFYFPIKLAQGLLTSSEIIRGFTMQITFSILLGSLLSLEIKRGLKHFEGVGR